MKYGMKLRGYSPGCQPMNGLVKRQDDPTNRYYDILEYDRELTEEETQTYSLEKLEEINYQVMSDDQMVIVTQETRIAKKYQPDYDELIKNSTCAEEAQAWQKCKDNKSTFAFNMVYATRQSCGHWEVFQTPQNKKHHPLDEKIRFAKQHAETRRCTRCICNR